MRRIFLNLFSVIFISSCGETNTTQNVIINPSDFNNPNSGSSILKEVKEIKVLPEQKSFFVSECSSLKFDAMVTYSDGSVDSDVIWSLDSNNFISIDSTGLLKTSYSDYDRTQKYMISFLSVVPKKDSSKKIKLEIKVLRDPNLKGNCKK